MRVFITGAGGFVGGRLCPRLRAEGHEVIATDRELDVADEAGVDAAIRAARPEAIVHLAAQSSVADSWKSPLSTYRVNYLGARSILLAAERRAPRARVLLIGTGDLYAPASAQGPACREIDPIRPRSPYARGKAAGEQLAHLAAERGLDVMRVRPFNHSGAGQSDRFVASNFARQIAGIRSGRRAPRMRVGNLESVRDFLHVDDVIEAYLALLSPETPCGTYNVASGIGTSIRTLLDTLARLADVEPELEVDPDRFRPTDWLVGDASRLRGHTGWSPSRSLEQVLQELLEHWLARPEAPARA